MPARSYPFSLVQFVVPVSCHPFTTAREEKAPTLCAKRMKDGLSGQPWQTVANVICTSK